MLNKFALRVIAVLCVLATSLGSMSLNAVTDPEQDRLSFIELYQKKFPDRPLDDYVFGALMLSEDAKQQYDSIMEFPPFSPAIEAGKAQWEKPFKNGKSFAECFPNDGKLTAGNYPQYDEKLGKVVTFEMSINQCLVANDETPLKISDMKSMGVLMSYARTLSDGMKMNIKVNGAGAQAAYDAGKNYFYTRRGQLGFSCASCHVENAGNRIRSEVLSTAVGQATHWPVFRAGDALTSLQVRYAGCNRSVRAEPLKIGGDEYNNLEYFHSYLSNGLPMQASVYRK